VSSADGTHWRTAETDPRYWNMIGPFGGWSAALLVDAVMAQSDDAYTPISGSFSFARGLVAGTFEIGTRVVRRNRSTVFWWAQARQRQGDDDAHCAHASIVLARRRASPAYAELTMPPVPPPEDLAAFGPAALPVEWPRMYDMRPAPVAPGGSAVDGTRTLWWVRALDRSIAGYAGLTALCDTTFPRIFYRLARPVPISTVTMNVFFHAGAGDVARIEGDFLLADASMRVASRGFYDEHALLWSRDGRLIAATEQIVWFRTEGEEERYVPNVPTPAGVH